MSRSIGDFKYKETGLSTRLDECAVCCVPEVNVYQRRGMSMYYEAQATYLHLEADIVVLS
jgi:hypothetical protein